ncbi:hypothetical protein G6F70_006482 [Rhizopus microsporus]|nr:hypothetical protein G6F71_000678 [Rhizopus microsporus]KAG1197612.1 hypothetical protein G6F70_006482 [Rhizopus microsporus]KAG1213279.1 hypothetical protein G6F69_002974 [Rhizopus microsporus]KAG1235242.1 hypothetical protein G6F67_002927 [Rhizopus microsporus]KAG1267314.1 hypothetical protein G6F68_002020 [Rhizopus microsporus]
MQPVIHLHINSSYNDKPTHMVQEGLAISPFITRVPFMETSSFISSLDETLATLPLHPYYISPFTVPSQASIEQEDREQVDIENKLLNDVFFSPPAMMSPSSELGFSKVDDVSDLTELSMSLFERTSSICSSNSSSEDEDYCVQDDNHTLFLCDFDLEAEQKSDQDNHSGIKRNINECTVSNRAINRDAPCKKRKTKEKKDSATTLDAISMQHSSDSRDEHQYHQQYEYSKSVTVIDQKKNDTIVEPIARSSSSPTLYETFTKQNIDWCRYCGTTEGINWRPGPWGKRTLCNKHGCDYKGYGFACKLPRLDLTEYLKEPLAKRTRPILQLYCSVCQKKESWQNNRLIFCDGCPKSFHQQCFHKEISNSVLESDESWYCTDACSENITRKRVVIELSRKRLPLMRTPKNALLQSTS